MGHSPGNVRMGRRRTSRRGEDGSLLQLPAWACARECGDIATGVVSRRGTQPFPAQPWMQSGVQLVAKLCYKGRRGINTCLHGRTMQALTWQLRSRPSLKRA